MNTDINNKFNDASRSAVRTMLEAHLKMAEMAVQQSKLAEEQALALMASSRRSAELSRDLVQGLGKAWMDSMVPGVENKAETKASK